MMIEFSEFKSCVNTPPKEDGTYIVIKFNERNKMIYAASIDYTTKYGWNTNCFSNDHAITYEEDAFWATVSKKKGDAE